MSDHHDISEKDLVDEWSVAKLIGIAALVLGSFFAFIYNASP